MSGTAIVLLLYFIGWADPNDPGLTAMLLGLAWVYSPGRADRIDENVLNLPVTSLQIAASVSANVFMRTSVGCVVAAILVRQLTGAPWMILEPALFLGGVAVCCSGSVALMASGGSGNEELESFASYLTACVGAVFFSPIDSWVSYWKDIPAFGVWALLLALPFLGWLALVFATHRVRIGKKSVALAVAMWGEKLERLRREFRTSTYSQRDAVFALDWLHSRTAVVVGAWLFAIATNSLAPFSDATVLIFPWSVYVCVAATACFATAEFFDSDRTANGEFRWTLPASDVELASGVMRHIFACLLVWWTAGLTCFVGAAAVLYVRGQLQISAIEQVVILPAHPVILVITVGGLAVVPLLVGWVAATKAIESTTLGCGSRLTQWLAILVVVGVISTAFAASEPARWVVWQAFCFLAGSVLLAGSALRVRAALAYGLVQSRTVMWLTIGWVLSGLIGIIVLGGLQLHHAAYVILLVGLLTLVFRPFASLPLAIFARRHCY